ncbi:hypothetical protein PF005_g12798 [Phytophthora fragariae]|uniref:Uncharacterized protein n=2 Tax=Phytophthora fragariae TaxID=53985 RepID=A0A6A3EU17_9STRA|nr:hypothetical protein PF003_g2047 [Phytophthora fragariae]KAE8936063.1 hypothetical protein PF009_g14007 [Phytophthora fragariae]KAE9008343.1 hypothetical protein PF011_g10745 [Phytophthora fragariae]KAE9084775.1 hypothetical protein PF010_g20698 [Phytophthora fragariae]KAE9109651.1 hypothetical protein PF007_g12169 [Phytophthora fragariae]
MLGLKPFVQESVQALPPAQLRLLAETLRIDLRGCEDRGDIERVLTGLVCLDQDTALGVFLAWLRSADLQQHKIGILASKKPTFNNTFLPAISSSTNNQARVKDHHLDDEIKQQLAELDVLETSFKKAERLVHTGSPSFEKLKQFLMELTILRAKEQSARAFLVRQADVLRAQHDEMRAEMLHSRAQLDFFVEGFTNLRKRHDALLEDATRMKAESETTQGIFVSMSAHDCYFEQLMQNTLWQQMRDNDEMKRRLQHAHDELEAAARKRKELETQISQLKQERGDVRKDAYCYKRQLRVCKARMRRLQQAGGGVNGSFFRDQAVALRQTVATLVGLLRDAVVRDTKSPKQTLSKEALRILRQVLTPSVSTSESESWSSRGADNQQEPETEEADPAQPRVIERQTSQDIDEVIRGVLLVEGATPTDGAECARIMGEKLKYLPVDLKQTLAQLQQDEETQALAAREEEQRKLQLAVEQQQQSEGQEMPTPSNVPVTPAAPRPVPTLEAYAGPLKKHVLDLMAAQGKRGFVMYNWPFSRRDVNLLTAMGLPVDSVINLEIVGGVQPPPPTPATIAPVTPAVGAAPLTATPAKPKPPTVTTKPTSTSSTTRGKAPTPSTTARGKASPSKSTVASKSPAKPAGRTAAPTAAMKTRASSPTRPAAVSPKKPTSSVSSSPSKPRTPSTPAKPGSSSSQLKPKTTEGAKTVKKVPTAASMLQGLGGILQSVGPAAFPVERVNAILQVLEQQKRRKLAPIVQWDETTRRTNEMLAMWAEEIHTLVHLEQESRKPQKAPPPTPAASATKSTTSTSPKRGTSPTKTGSKTLAIKAKVPASPTRSSPTKAKTTSTSTTKARPPKK